MLASARFYEGRAEGLGPDSLAAVEETTRRIEQFADAGPTEGTGIRRRLVLGFPFTVLYSHHEGRVFIVAVMHQHRRPGYWKERLRN